MSTHPGFYSDNLHLYYNDSPYTGEKDGIYYKNGTPASGYVRGLLHGIDGSIQNGLFNDKYYNNGLLASGLYGGVLYKNGVRYIGLASNNIISTWANLISTDIGTSEKYYNPGIVNKGILKGKTYGNNGLLLNNEVANGCYYYNGSLGSGLFDNVLYKNGVRYTGPVTADDFLTWKNIDSTNIGEQELYFNNGVLGAGVFKGISYDSYGLRSLTETLSGELYMYHGYKGSGVYNGKLYKDGYAHTGGVSPSKLPRSIGFNGHNVSHAGFYINGDPVIGDMMFVGNSDWDISTSWILPNGTKSDQMPDQTKEVVIIGQVTGFSSQSHVVKGLSAYDHATLGGDREGQLTILNQGVFADYSINKSTLLGYPVTFKDYSENEGVVNNGVFKNHSINSGTVVLSAIFDDYSSSIGRIMGELIVKNSATITGYVYHPLVTQTNYDASSALYFKANAAENNWYDTYKWFSNSLLTVPSLGLPFSATTCYIEGSGNVLVNMDDGRWVDPKVIMCPPPSVVIFRSTADHTIYTSVSGNVEVYYATFAGNVSSGYVKLWDDAVVTGTTQTTPILDTTMIDVHHMYFSPVSGTNWFRLPNWFYDRTLTVPATSLPNNGSFCYLTSAGHQPYNLLVDIDDVRWESPLYIESLEISQLTFTSRYNAPLTSTIMGDVVLSNVHYY